MNLATNKPRIHKYLWVAIIVVLLVVIAMVCAIMFNKMNANGDVKANQYQAVFLTNGQVYFGKLTDVNRGYVKVSDVYYLQVQQDVQQQQSAEKKDDSQVSIAKLGNELHGPEDVMNISRDQVLFWENLKDDSKVVQAIKDYQKK